jgi:hypothetical protein
MQCNQSEILRGSVATCPTCGRTEKPLTLKALAADLGLPYWKLQRGAKTKAFPTYALFNSRKLAFKSQVLASMKDAGADQ